MKTNLIAIQLRSNLPDFPALYRYIGPDEKGKGEIILVNGMGEKFVIHSVTPDFPVGHKYGCVLLDPIYWERVNGRVTIDFDTTR